MRSSIGTKSSTRRYVEKDGTGPRATRAANLTGTSLPPKPLALPLSELAQLDMLARCCGRSSTASSTVSSSGASGAQSSTNGNSGAADATPAHAVSAPTVDAVVSASDGAVSGTANGGKPDPCAPSPQRKAAD